MRIIIHVDMNAYFASVEKIINPSLKDKPIAVGSPFSRGVISTACYIARKYGVKSAMPTYIAKKLCKNLVIVHSNFKAYEEYQQKFLAIIRDYSSIIEVASIDECYVDMTERLKNDPKPLNTIKSIQDRIYNEIGLTCSIGISNNKFLAKMASDYQKPNGFTVISKKNLSETLWKLPIGDMFGIGQKTAPRLKEIGIDTIGDLAKCDKENYELKKILGSNTGYFINCANGIENSKVEPEPEPCKSIGNSETLPSNTNNYDEIVDEIKKLALSVSNRAKQANMVGKTVTLQLKFASFKSITRSKNIGKYTNDKNEIIKYAVKLLDQNYSNEMIRLVGVTLGETKENVETDTQLSFNFNEKTKSIKDIKAEEVINKINEKYGKTIVKLGK